MKGGTAARIVRYVVIVAVVIILAYPIVSQVTSLNSPDGEISIGVDAVYDLGRMDEESLTQNIDMVASPDMRIVFGNSSIQLSGMHSDIAERVLASGAETATVVDASGQTVRQSYIEYSDSLTSTIETALTMAPSMAAAVQPDIIVTLEADGVSIPVTSESQRDGGEIRLTVRMPYMVSAVASALGCDMMMSIGATYMGVAGATVSIDSGTFSGGSFTSTGGSIAITGDFDAESGEGTIGSSAFTVTNGQSTRLVIDDVSAVRSGVTDDRLTITMGDDTYTMDEGMTSGFLAALDMMEATQ